MRYLFALPFIAALIAPHQAMAQVAAADSGDTGWMILCALLVMIAALPGPALRHAGQVNMRNALSMVTRVLVVTAIVSLIWGIVGYSLAFAPGSQWLGSGENLLLANLADVQDGMTIPESAFILFQMSIAVLTATLVMGAVSERARIGWVVGFVPLWLLLVYIPLVYAIWGGGWLAELGVMDFAGGLVIHTLAGFSALALVLIVGKRDATASPGHAPVMAMAGSALLWIGMCGAIGGWAMGATDNAATSILNMYFAASAAALTWALIGRITGRKPTAMGVMSGAMTGIAAISACAALVGTGGAMVIGMIAGIVSRLGSALIAGRVDDATGIFAVHGLGGITGVMLLPLFTLPLMGGVGFDPGISVSSAMMSQGIGVAIVGLWAMVGTAIATLMVSVIMPAHSVTQHEQEEPDSTQYDLVP